MHYLSVTTTPSPMSKSGPGVFLISSALVSASLQHKGIFLYRIKPCFITTMHNKIITQAEIRAIVIKVEKIRNRYNQVPHLTQDTNGEVTNSQLDTTSESQEVSPFPAGDHKAHINRHVQRQSKHKTENIKDPQRSTSLERSVKYLNGGFKPGLTVHQPHP